MAWRIVRGRANDDHHVLDESGHLQASLLTRGEAEAFLTGFAAGIDEGNRLLAEGVRRAGAELKRASDDFAAVRAQIPQRGATA